MDEQNVRFLYTIGTYVSGFFDFVVAVVVILFAMTVVRRVDGTTGYVLAAAMGVRFVAACCTRAVGQSVAYYPGLPEVAAALTIVRPFFDLAMWAAVVFSWVQLARKASPTPA